MKLSLPVRRATPAAVTASGGFKVPDWISVSAPSRNARQKHDRREPIADPPYGVGRPEVCDPAQTGRKSSNVKSRKAGDMDSLTEPDEQGTDNGLANQADTETVISGDNIGETGEGGFPADGDYPKVSEPAPWPPT